MDAVLKIYGDIGSDVTDVMVANFLDSNQAASNITVRVNSFGGDVQTGWNIYDLLKSSGKNIKTIGEGRVYSIATVIFLAGGEREMLPNSDGIIHMPRITEMMDQEEEKILNLYTQVTGKDKEILKDYMKKETALSAEDMVTMGFATKVTEQYKAVAYFNFKSNIMDEKTVKTFGEKLDAIIAKVSNFSRLSTTDQTLTDKEGKELKLEKESGAPAVGDKCTPDGSYVMTDGKTITVLNGVITAISEKAEDKTELEIANEKIATLSAQLAEVETAKSEALKAKTEAEAAKAETVAKETEAVTLINELKALKNSWKPEGRSHVNFTSGKVGQINIDKVKELTQPSNN